VPHLKYPNLFVIGAMKAGTSSLHEYLHQHPDIFMSRLKEPQYFSPNRTPEGILWGQGNPNPEPGIGWYLRLFDGAGSVKYAGESTTNYAKEPVINGSAQHIYDFNPAARIVYILRDPLARIISHYWYYVAAKVECRTFDRAVAQDVQYKAYSDYARQVRPYWRLFGMENVYLLTFEELLSNPHCAMRDLFGWLQVDSDFELGELPHINETPKVFRRLRPAFSWTDSIRRHWRWASIASRIPKRMADRFNLLMTVAEDRELSKFRFTLESLRDFSTHVANSLQQESGFRASRWKSVRNCTSDDPLTVESCEVSS